VLQLRDEGVDPVELALAAQEVRELDPGVLAVEVAVEVEQVRLEQRVVGVLVERRAATEIDRTRVPLAVTTQVPTGVDAVGRQAHGVGHLDVGRREAEQASPLVALHDRPAGLERAPEHRRGQFDLATGHRTPDGGGADRFLHPVGAVDEFERGHLEVVGLPEPGEQRDVALPPTAEVEVLTDDDLSRSQ